MSDCRIREFRAQLTTTMDSVLKRAMFEIMKIFENSLHDHQMDLVQKGEEIAQLKMKLQRVEIKLRESECGGDRGAEMNKTQREPEDAPNAANVPEIDFEVPDDWCAPLGCETVTKQEEGVCPSIRLRQLYIPLWHIPIIKQEVENRNIESHKQTKGLRRSRRGSSIKERHKHTQNRSSPMHGRRTRRGPLRNDMKQLLRDMKLEYSDLTGRPTGLRRGGRNSTGKEQQNTLRSKREERKIAATESEPSQQETAENDNEKKYSCKFCKKEFNTLFGQSVHVRSHKRCRGCKKEFPFPSTLKCHEPYCAKLNKLLAIKAQSTEPPKPPSCDEEKTAAPKKQVAIKKETSPFSSGHSESFIQTDGPTKKHSCSHCKKKFVSHYRMKEHVRVHTGEKPFPCSMCSKKFRLNQLLKKHMMRMHKGQVDSSETNGGLSWTMPLEVIEDNQEDLISVSKDTRRTINHNTVQRECNPDEEPVPRWQTMGTQCTDGFTCLLCHKVMKNKYMLIEHFRTHTGEKPLKCIHCPAKFHSSKLLSLHRKKCGKYPMIQCEKCEKIFSSQSRHDKHVYKHHRDWPHSCKVCGKGFRVEGRLSNHMEQHK